MPEEEKDAVVEPVETPTVEDTATTPATEASTDTDTPSEEVAAEEEVTVEETLAGSAINAADLRPGMTVRVYQKIKEGAKERVQMFQGIIIAMHGQAAVSKTITVQKKSFGVWVEKIFPLASPLIEKIEVVKIAKVRRAKLYYLTNYKKKLKETLVKQS
jgi:large subunit ribosomal protein L19